MSNQGTQGSQSALLTPGLIPFGYISELALPSPCPILWLHTITLCVSFFSGLNCSCFLAWPSNQVTVGFPLQGIKVPQNTLPVAGQGTQASPLYWIQAQGPTTSSQDLHYPEHYYCILELLPTLSSLTWEWLQFLSLEPSSALDFIQTPPFPVQLNFACN